MLKFLCDGQGAVRVAILYADTARQVLFSSHFIASQGVITDVIMNHKESNEKCQFTNTLCCQYSELIVFIPPMAEIANFNKKYFTLSKIYTDEGGIK